jgi:hypothetical protein
MNIQGRATVAVRRGRAHDTTSREASTVTSILGSTAGARLKLKLNESEVYPSRLFDLTSTHAIRADTSEAMPRKPPHVQEPTAYDG